MSQFYAACMLHSYMLHKYIVFYILRIYKGMLVMNLPALESLWCEACGHFFPVISLLVCIKTHGFNTSLTRFFWETGYAEPAEAVGTSSPKPLESLRTSGHSKPANSSNALQ